MMKDLKQCREEIDAIDQEIMKLFEQRMDVAKDVVNYKIEHQLEIFQQDREKEVIQKNVNRLKNKGLEIYAQSFIQDLMNISKSYQSTFIPITNQYILEEPHYQEAVVGFQGTFGSFSEQALDSFFEDVKEKKSYKSFEDVFVALENNDIDYGVLPYENSSTGVISDNYDLIRNYDFYIVGEQNISISQHLLGIKGAKIEDIKEVYSHPQGLLQSSQFLSQYPYIEQIDFLNTATAAKHIQQQCDKSKAAIASKQAAQLYDLDILKENIHNEKTNTTRFIIISKSLQKHTEDSSVSIVFTLAHQTGALYEILKIIKNYHINMIRIESRPVVKKPWEYYFYIDFEGHIEQKNILMAIEDIRSHTDSLRVLGNYIKKQEIQ